MKLFKSKAEKELENIIGDIKINLSNNYKEPAHKARMKLKDRKSVQGRRNIGKYI